MNIVKVMELETKYQDVILNDLTINSFINKGNAYIEHEIPVTDGLSQDDLATRLVYSDPNKVIGVVIDTLRVNDTIYAICEGMPLPDNRTYEMVPRLIMTDELSTPICLGLDFNLIEVNDDAHLYMPFSSNLSYK